MFKITRVLETCILIVMRASEIFKAIKSRQHPLAWLAAIVADAIQIVALPLFVGGAFSPADTLLDITVAAILFRLLGWHWALLPGLVAELIPGLDLFPTWTAAVFYVTRQRVRSRGLKTLSNDGSPV